MADEFVGISKAFQDGMIKGERATWITILNFLNTMQDSKPQVIVDAIRKIAMDSTS